MTKGGTTFLPNEERTVSFYYYGTYGTRINPYIGGGTGSFALYSDDATSGNGTTSIGIPVSEDGWQRVTFKIKNTSVTDSTFGWGWMILHHNTPTVTLDNNEFWKFTGFQVEKKPYATPYVNGLRSDIVKDYSNNNKNLTLNLATTPVYKNHYYDFNGTSTLISAASQNLDTAATYNTGEATVSMWINSRNFTNGISRYIAGYHYLTINPSGKLQNMVHKPTEGVNYWLYSNTTIENNKWYHIVYTIKNNAYVRYYINGKLDANYETNDIGIISYSTDSAIGATYSNFFNGYIDDFRVYKRSLSEKELSELYYKNKHKYN